MSALLNIKQFVRFDEHGSLTVPNKLTVNCAAFVQTPLLNDDSNRVATTEWVRAQLTNITGISYSESDPVWASDKTYYYTKLQSDARYLQSFTETDPTVPAWAKAANKPTYAYSELTGLPTLFSGSYLDLTNKPTLFSGAYADLTGKPTLFSGSYIDLTNKPTIPAAQVNSDWNAITGLAQILNKPTLFSGVYSDLTGKPTLFSGSYTDLTNKPTLFSGAYADLTGKPTIPTNNNELTNGAGYLTSYTETDPIWTSEKANYALKTYVDTSISNLVASAPAALNTLNELALALGSDANFSTTITTLIGTKEPSITAGTTLQYWRGDKTWQTLPIYILPTASTTVLGGVKVDGSTITINGSGVISGANTYSLPTASSTVLGGIKVGTNLSIDVNGVLSSTDTNTTYSVFTGATASANGTAGLVIAPLISNRAQYLKGDGTWGTPPDTIVTSLAWTSITGRPTALSSFTNDLGNYGSFLTAESDTLATVTARGSSTAQNITFSNGRKGLVGVYDAAQTQAIFAMGASYVLTNGGASNVYGSFYGLAWSYNPDYGGAGNNPQSKAGLNHQLLLMQNGITTAAMGSGIWTSGNISAANFSGSHSGTSSGTNTGDQTNISGNAATATSASSATISTFVSSPDGDRVSGSKLPTGNPRAVRFDFANANSVTGATGSYAGVMTYAPWDGTTASTGDSSYQLAFINESGVNASGAPGLRFRNGIDSTWNGWTSIITSSNIGSYTAGGVAWGNVSGRPTALSQFTNDLGNYGGWVVRSGDSMSGRLTIDARNSTNLPLHVLSVEPYIQLEATGASNSTSFRMYPTGGFNASIGNYATGSLVLVAANSESVFVSGNGNITSNGGWFINNATFRGLHNSATSMYFASKDSGYYDISSSGTSVSSLRLFTGGNQADIRGYVYANTSNDVGFLHHNGGWAVRCNTSGVTLYGNSGCTGSFTAPAFYETSDIRYKDVIDTNPEITGLGIDVIKFTRHGSDIIRYGYSAQQVQNIIPESVQGTDILTINYMDVHTLKIASLERRVKELEDRLKSTL